jgi:Ca2+-binding EF-hand superfamily protein
MNRYSPATMPTVLIAALWGFALPAAGASNSSGPNSPIAVGSLIRIEEGGSKLIVKTRDHERTLKLHAKATVTYVGMPKKSEHKPTVGYGVKARVASDGQLKSILFTPPIPAEVPLGEDRLTLSEAEIFKKIDEDANGTIGYVEFSKRVLHSPKHGPDRFLKSDKDESGSLDGKEFSSVLAGVSWWKLSRITPEQWMKESDSNDDGKLTKTEFSEICVSSSHIDNVFKRADQDSSGDLDLKETKAYIRQITHGSAKTDKRKKRKSKNAK